MEIKAPLKQVLKIDEGLVPDYYKERKDRDMSDYEITVHDAHKLKPQILEAFKQFALQDIKDKVQGAAHRYQGILRAIRYVQQPNAVEREIDTLQELEHCLTEIVAKTSPDLHWVFREMPDGNMCPAYVNSIKYHPHQGRDNPAHVEMHLVWQERDKMGETTVYFSKESVEHQVREGDGHETYEPETHDDDGEDSDSEPEEQPTKRVRGQKRKVAEIIQAKKILVVQKQIMADYNKAVKRLTSFCGKVGEVVSGVGTALYCRTRRDWHNDDTGYDTMVADMDPEGVPAELVLDDTNVEKVEFGTVWSFWGRSRSRDDIRLSEFWKEKKRPVLPLLPYVLCFDLRKHMHAYVHIDRVSVRMFEDGISEKLVLPSEDKQFIEMLMKSADLKLDDIIRSKSGGVFVLSEGPPGTGKTLTAEVYAEAMHRPLYSVQCSQLGVDPDDIEKRLKRVMSRAERFGAVLLLDEADVYIRSRGTDIQHNAIVGVMLRIIEYYSGLLFMTTNLHDLDDAIRSRATAHVVYRKPSIELLSKIWAVLAEQFKVELNEDDIKKLVKEWPDLVGRDVKNLLKLTRFLCVALGQKGSAEMVLKVSRYQKVGQGK